MNGESSLVACVYYMVALDFIEVSKKTTNFQITSYV